MNVIKKIICVAIFLFYSSISISAVLNISNGQLIGASGVNVNGSSYNVAFIDGTCADLFSGCDQNSDFTFSNPSNDGTLLGQAMTALLEQVIIDSSDGGFDSNPALTNGCNVAGGCQISTPLFVGGSTEFVAVIGAFNTTALEQGQVQFLDHLTAGTVVRNSIHPFPEFDQQVFAVWSPSAVPVPAAVWLFGSGLIGLVGMKKRSSKFSTFSA